MAALCLDASRETLRPLCCRRTLRLQGDLCRRLRKGSPQVLQAVMTLPARHVLQNSPQFIVQGYKVCTPRKPILGADEGQKVPSQPCWVVFAFWAGTESCWKTHSWLLKRFMLRCFTTPCSTSSWYTRTPVSPLSCKNEDVTELIARPSKSGEKPAKETKKYKRKSKPVRIHAMEACGGGVRGVLQSSLLTKY